MNNLAKAWIKARKGKTKKNYVIEFEKNTRKNLFKLQKELLKQTYKPKPLIIFILRDPKTRKISKADFRDRIIHHALCNIIEPIFDKTFICDNCANRKHKGTLFALQRLKKFKLKVTKNLHSSGHCFRADVKHYFRNIDHKILLRMLQRKIRCQETLQLIKIIIKNERYNKSSIGNICNSSLSLSLSLSRT